MRSPDQILLTFHTFCGIRPLQIYGRLRTEPIRTPKTKVNGNVSSLPHKLVSPTEALNSKVEDEARETVKAIDVYNSTASVAEPGKLLTFLIV
jgi:hypothetical protein